MESKKRKLIEDTEETTSKRSKIEKESDIIEVQEKEVYYAVLLAKNDKYIYIRKLRLVSDSIYYTVEKKITELKISKITYKSIPMQESKINQYANNDEKVYIDQDKKLFDKAILFQYSRKIKSEAADPITKENIRMTHEQKINPNGMFLLLEDQGMRTIDSLIELGAERHKIASPNICGKTYCKLIGEGIFATHELFGDFVESHSELKFDLVCYNSGASFEGRKTGNMIFCPSEDIAAVFRNKMFNNGAYLIVNTSRSQGSNGIKDTDASIIVKWRQHIIKCAKANSYSVKVIKECKVDKNSTFLMYQISC